MRYLCFIILFSLLFPVSSAFSQTVLETQSLISEFVSARASQIISTAPDFLTRTTTPIRDSAGIVRRRSDHGVIGVGSDISVWSELKYSRSSNGKINSDGESLHINYGYDYAISDSYLLGLLLQYDSTVNDQRRLMVSRSSMMSSNLDGEGVLIGPYFVSNLTESLVLDVHLGYGVSKNAIDPVGLYIDEFETDRLVISGSLSGTLDVSSGLLIRPRLTYAYYSEHQDEYSATTTSPTPMLIPSRDLSTTRLSFGPQFMRDTPISRSLLSTSFGFSAVYTDTDYDAQSFGNDVSLRLGSGVLFTGYDGVDMNLDIYYDGIGLDTKTYGLSLLLNINY